MALIQKILHFHKEMNEDRITLIYDGEINQMVTKAFAGLTDQSIQSQQEDEMVKKRVFHVMVETLQNISKHSKDSRLVDNNRIGSGIFAVSQDDNGFQVTSGNKISASDAPKIQKILEEVNGLEKPDLKKLYIKKIKEGKLSEKGGAGLGFIDMAKKTGAKFEYYFEKVDDDTTFFFITINVARN